MSRWRFFILAAALFQPLAMASLAPDQVGAKVKGAFLYNLNRHTDAVPFLKVAAEEGDRESQYFLGEVLRKRATFVDDLSKHWFELAAHQDDVYAMIRLFKTSDEVCKYLNNCAPETRSPKHWRETAHALAMARAEKGDGEAMYQLYLMSGEFDWLIKSAEAGFGEGQYWLSVEYRQGEDFFIVPGSRLKTADKWLVAAANSNYVPAIEKLTTLLAERNDIGGIMYWTERAAKAGGIEATLDLAAWMTDTSDYLKLPLDLVKGYGLMLVVAQAELPSRRGIDERQLKKLERRMKPEQITAGKAFAEEWKKTNAPLSRFPIRYGL